MSFFSLQMAGHHAKGESLKPLLCNHQAPKTQSHTNANQMWVSCRSSITNGLLFSGNDLVNPAFRGAKSLPLIKASKHLSCYIRKTEKTWINQKYKGDMNQGSQKYILNFFSFKELSSSSSILTVSHRSNQIPESECKTS